MFRSIHIVKSLAKMSKIKKGKSLSIKTRIKFFEIQKDKTDIIKIKAKINKAQSGVNYFISKKYLCIIILLKFLLINLYLIQKQQNILIIAK